MLASFEKFVFCFLFLKILTKFSDCLTESFFSIILFATKLALSRPTKILACPAVSLLFSIKLITSAGNVKSLKQFVM